MNDRQSVCLPYPGRRTRNAAKMAIACMIITITILGSIGTWLPGLVTAFGSLFPASTQANRLTCPQLSNSTGSQLSCPVPSPGGNNPNQVGANPLPNLSLPKTVLSTVDTIDTAGVLQTSAQNLTLYNSRVVLRLLGGSKPRDQLIGPGNQVLSHSSFWDALVNLNGS